ncbi:6305_t:CDS:2 [Cetraspora pellucida]|uniref:6305_t:CDS:1 n=1 Tax=Cetraspora pellucida TaxID=1433469 RepID=A0ACA9KJR8_9GLOM|nr:6305_t:CDS:2 [Cetraspora pellucida]
MSTKVAFLNLILSHVCIRSVCDSQTHLFSTRLIKDVQAYNQKTLIGQFLANSNPVENEYYDSEGVTTA